MAVASAVLPDWVPIVAVKGSEHSPSKTPVLVSVSLPVSVSWTWRPGYLWTDGGGNSGEYFDAMTYEGDDYVATIATRDGDWLAQSATSGGFVPERFGGQVDEFYMLPWVKYRNDGLVVDVPALARGEKVTVFLSVAWSDRERDGQDGDSSTWFAAEE